MLPSAAPYPTLVGTAICSANEHLQGLEFESPQTVSECSASLAVDAWEGSPTCAGDVPDRG